MTTETKHSAKDEVSWLVSRVAEQARADTVRLTQSELEQLSFSEETASPIQVAAAEDFDAENDVSAFEAKIAKLLGSAYKQDIEKGDQSAWHKHLAALRDKDVYILVMVDQAGIPRPKPKLLATLAPASPRRILPVVRFAVSAFVILAGLLYFFVFTIRWERRNPNSPYVFGELGRFRLNDNMSALFFVAWLVSLFLMWRETADKKKR